MYVVLGLAAALVVGLLVGVAAAGWRRRAATTQTATSTRPTSLSPQVIEVIQALPGMSIVVDASDRVERASPRADALGLVRRSELAHPEILDLVRAVRRDGDTREVELDVARGPVGPGTLALRIQVARLGAEHVIALVEDLTYSRRVEETRRDFVVNVSHELKTPVGGLSLLAEAVEGASDDPDAVRRFAGRMHAETARLTRLVQEIVELSRLQVSDTFDEPVPVDVVACAHEAVDHVRLLAEDKRIELIQASPTGTDVRIFGDPALLTTAIRNLLENAIHYSDPGTRVALTVRRQGALASVAVTDQGAGISPVDQERIFERFYRVDPARSRRTGGTGLGLAIVKHVVAGHGGEVSVWSEEGQGSTFTLHLPVPPALEDAPDPGGRSIDRLPSHASPTVPGKATS
ncbi:ATP-binding protein [Allobranchiibius sp. GilTou38]|uniref:sensor histidine kinase n=1 Tax=Allobranchiibius sp. GilTou38 TaxID=2815210 RepID=UPI003260B150